MSRRGCRPLPVLIAVGLIIGLVAGSPASAADRTAPERDEVSAAPAPVARPDGPAPAGEDPEAHGTRGTPVDPTPFELRQPDGSVVDARRWGDGVHNGVEDLAGYTIDQDASGTWRYAEDVDRAGQLVLGDQPAGDAPPSDVEPGLRSDDPGPLPTPGSAELPAEAPHVPHVGPAPTLVILTQFTDQPSVGGPTTASQWASRFFGASASVADYYDDASYGALDVVPATETHGTASDGVVGWVTVPRTHPNTGSTDTVADYTNVNATTAAAVVAADPFVDFSTYDTDDDGTIETDELHVVIITAGFEASSGCSSSVRTVWGHRWAVLYVDPPVADGTEVAGPAGGYLMFGERHCDEASNHMATVGIMVHELGHDLGWPDLYDTTYATRGGVGEWSVMAMGSWSALPGALAGSSPPLPDAFMRSLQGWVTPTEVSGTGQAVTVPSATTSSTVYRVLANPGGVDWSGSQSGTGEYFLIENRQLSGWDASLPGCGILIWHIDETRPSFRPNDVAARRLIQLEQADGLGHLDGSANNYGDAGDPYPGSASRTSFAAGTTPSSRLYGGVDSGVSVQVPAGACTASKAITISATGTTPVVPANDPFSSPTVVSGASGSSAGSNVGATKEAGEPDHAGDDGGASVWWRWTAPASGRVTISSAGSSFDTVLGVYTGTSVGGLTLRASNDDAPGVLTSRVADVPVTAGTAYRIAVDGFDGGSGPATGTVSLAWSFTPDAGSTPFPSWAAYVDRQCRDFLGALCQASSRTWWINNLTANPGERGALVEELRASAYHGTYVDPVARLYRAFFLRHPDRSGLQYWITQRASGKGLFYIANFFASSTEFRTMYGSLGNRAFVELVYTNVLGRLGEQSGMDFWTAELASGRRTRGAVMVGFSESSEYRTKETVNVDVALVALLMLRRPPTNDEMTFWRAEAVAGRMDDVALAEWVLTSSEYAALL